MEISELENRLKKLTEDINKETFIYDLLLAYDFPKATISRIKSGDLNLSKNPSEILFKKKLLFKSIGNEDLHDVIDELSNDKQIAKHEPRLIIVTDFITLLAQDIKTKDTLDVNIEDLFKHSDFFFPWLGKEKIQFTNENVVDIKAAIKLGQLYDNLILDNHNINQSEEFKHALNIFFARLLFCLFAEDTEIFSKSIFTNSIANHSMEDGSDLKGFFERLFLNLNKKDKSDEVEYLKYFPYVNGGLFKDNFFIPFFSRKSRQIIIESGQLDWKGINPDIFGSMVQAIADPEERSNFGMHYTSVENIMKVLKPLFLDELYDDYENAKQSESLLEKLLGRIYKIKFFDPACGSGNFLIITYKEICMLEMKIYQALQDINPSKWKIAASNVRVNQFYGITINDFDSEIAKLSLWLTEHQMNMRFKDIFGNSRQLLPLQEAGNIFCGNALRQEWESICPNNKRDEIYIFGNPPYRGARLQQKNQKEDLAIVFGDLKGFNNLDYIAGWFQLGAKYIKDSHAQLGMVSTNSIIQGEQVNLLWPEIFEMNIQINFAYKSFRWTNNAKNKAVVFCVIIGLSSENKKYKYIYENGLRTQVSNINGYLTDAKNIFIKNKSIPPAGVTPMMFGSMPNDGGHLLLSASEKKHLVLKEPNSEKWLKKLVGAEEFLHGKERWCLWLEGENLSEVYKIPAIKEIVDRVREERIKSKRPETKKLAEAPHLFGEIRQPKSGNYILVPGITSERREYIPMAYLDHNIISTNRNLIIPNASLYEFGVLHSKVHMAWIRAVGGKMKTDYSYSSKLIYNNFPWPEVSEEQKIQIKKFVLSILGIREKFSDKTISELYDPYKMPLELKEAHAVLDIAVEKLYKKNGFSSEQETLDFLFNLYKELTTHA
jgi:type II restriction/modification system DNA methylase subunit YeeA